MDNSIFYRSWQHLPNGKEIATAFCVNKHRVNAVVKAQHERRTLAREVTCETS
jgi:hypothetical protein